MLLKAFRMTVVLIAYCMIYQKPVSSQGFFSSLFMFTSPLICDFAVLYKCGKDGDITYQKVLGVFGGGFCGFYCLIAVLGLMGIIVVDLEYLLIYTNKNFLESYSINLQTLLNIMLLIPGLTALELFGKHERIPKNSGQKSKPRKTMVTNAGGRT